MVNITLSVSEEIKSKMNRFPEINWSEIARAAITKRILLLEEMNKLLFKSEMTDEDAINLGRKISHAFAKKYLKLR